MTDNVAALRTCCTVHDHERGTDDSMKMTTESQKIAGNIYLQTISQHNSLNPLIATLKPQSNGPSYSNTVICTLAVDGWAVTFGTARRGLSWAANTHTHTVY